MKKLILLSSLLAISASAFASSHHAEVIRVEPRMIIVHEQQCNEVLVEVHRPAPPSQQRENIAGGVLGAIAGAAIGNQIGGGSGKDIATAVGGVLGYQVGKGGGSSAPTQDTATTSLEKRVQCTTVPRQIQRGEIVTFRYKNRVFTQTFE